MQKLPLSIEKELETYCFTFTTQPVSFQVNDWLVHLEEMLTYTYKRLGTTIPGVAASMWMRKYALFVTGQFYMLSKYRLKWSGTITDLAIIDSSTDDQWLTTFLLKTNSWDTVEEKHIADAFHTLLKDFGAAMIEPLAVKTKTPKLVLWENIWGYLLWMYGGLLKEAAIAERVQSDIDLLLENDVWNSIERRSPFKIFQCFLTVPQAIDHYKRTTCCFYYELEGQEKCPYCPNATCNKN